MNLLLRNRLFSPFIAFDKPDNGGGAGETNQAPSNEAPPANANNTPAAINFTPEQDAHIKRLIDEDRKNRTPAPTPSTADADLAKVLKAHGFKSLEDALKPRGDKPATFTQEHLDEVKRTTETEWSTKYNTLQSEHTGFMSALAQKEIETAAHKAKFMDSAVADAAALLKDQVKWNAETKTFDVIDSNGQKRINFGTAKPMTVAELVTEFGNARPHMVQGANANGGGSSTNKTVDASGKTVYTREQLKDQKFYEANRDDIMRAAGEGRIR